MGPQGPLAMCPGGASVDAQGRAGDERGRLRQQEADGAADLGLVGQPSKRDVGREGPDEAAERFLVGVQPRRGDQPGRHLVDPHAGAAPLGRGRHGEVGHAGAGGAGVGHAGEAAAVLGGDVDDRAAVLAHPGVEHLAHHVEGADEVVADHRLEAPGRDLLERGGELAAGVVDQAVDAAVAVEHEADGRLDLRRVADVAGREVACSTALAHVGGDLGGDGLQLGLRPAQDHHLGAEAGQLVGDAPADAAAAPGHHHHVPVIEAGAQYGPVARAGRVVRGHASLSQSP